MAKEQKDQLNLTVVALVALVAIVGLVALVMNAGSMAGIATGSQMVEADAGEQTDVPILDDEGNMLGMVKGVNCGGLDLKRMYDSSHPLLRTVAESCCVGRDQDLCI